MNKNEEYVVDIIDNGFQGEGIAKIDNITVFIEGAIKGEKVKILIIKVMSSYAYGKIIEILETSTNRETPDCNTFNRCGGCELRHINYAETLKMKTEVVKNALYKELREHIQVNDCIGMENPTGYRNKLIYPVGVNRDNKYVMGVYAKRSHEIINVEKCHIQNPLCEEIAKDIFKFTKENNIKPYNEKTHKGTIRHIIIRIGLKTNEVMCVLVLNEGKFSKEKELIEYIIKKYPMVKTIVKNINMKNTNVILGDTSKVIYGDGYIYDMLGEYKFKISSLSFYQTNPIQTEVLYNKAMEYAELTGEETVFDLYCGIGTIAIFASKKAKQVYGIEVLEEAIIDAKENGEINNIKNVEFVLGEVEEALPQLVEEKSLSADVVFIDPPRKGSDKITLETLLKVEPKKIVYVSCNPATLARDIKMLQDKYVVTKVQPVDMFPYTSSIECVCLLKINM